MRLAILGASGHGKVIADIVLQSSQDPVIEFFDDNFPSLTCNEIWPVIGTTNDLINNAHLFDGIIIAIGNNKIRLAKQKALAAANARLVNVIHPRATVSTFASLGLGVVIMPGAVINAFSIISDACIVNTNAVVEHDVFLQEAVHISPGACLAGGVVVGEASWIGIGASVKQLIAIGSNVIVGAGSVVIDNIADNLTVAGVPAKPLKGETLC